MKTRRLRLPAESQSSISWRESEEVIAERRADVVAVAQLLQESRRREEARRRDDVERKIRAAAQ